MVYLQITLKIAKPFAQMQIAGMKKAKHGYFSCLVGKPFQSMSTHAA